MRIGIVVFSHTGHTLTLANKIIERLLKDGHTITLERLQTVTPLGMGATTADLITIPLIEQYEAILLGTPVRGGMPSRPMLRFLEEYLSFDGKKVVCFTTGFFRPEWGQNQTLERMKELCEAKQAAVLGVTSVRWWSLHRKHRISEVADYISTLLTLN